MSSFRTEINLPQGPFTLHHRSPLLTLGSCFAEHMGQKLEAYKFPIVRNPFGIIYNPVAIAQSLVHLLEAKIYQASDLFLQNERWHSFDHHGHFALPDVEESLEKINSQLQSARQLLTSQSTLLITLGTATVFEHLASGKIVSNCHKLPSDHFKRFRLAPEEVVAALAPALQVLQEKFPGVQCILTVSPVRHLKDGLIENQKSKATLLLAAEKLGQQFPGVVYFPAYEFQLDDLRDYRFYAADLLHPNQQAIDYIWGKFADHYFSDTTQQLNRRIEKILVAAKHRPFHPELKGHQVFLQKQLENMAALEKEFPFLNFAAERSVFEKSLH